ncbi:hypothetical protein PVAP13_2KG027700 [Panicum virgatum]|uniref:Uncharacterized protein n=1 Tax=Panicum virgatum TaxID=38727 RepID=A0A8T0W343_PANVG|nr:hypothetical protein PVAP13_2KG027700 [Panicum virgatum]
MRQGQSSWELQLLHHLPPRHPVVHVLLDGTGADWNLGFKIQKLKRWIIAVAEEE